MIDDDRTGGFTPLRATKFYIPLLLQAFSQSLTYPLVAAIVTHGRWGVETLTPFAQGQTVMFMIGALGGGLLTTGMVYARERAGFRVFKRLNAVFALALLSLQVLCSLPTIGNWIFADVLGLPREMSDAARFSLFWSIGMNVCFFIRNIPLVALFNARASFEANTATVIRIIATAACTPVFIARGWTGAGWGLVAMTFGCVIELVLSLWFARPYIRKMESGGNPAAMLKQFTFSVPLSLGAFILSIAPFLTAAFIGRSMGGITMVAIHYVTVGIAAPVCFAALRMQAVAIQFPPEYEGDRRVFRFAVVSGIALAAIPLILAFPVISGWYFGTMQNMATEDVARAQTVIVLYAVWPILQSLRGYAEGIASWRKHPNAVLTSHIVYIGILFCTLAVTLSAGVPGWLMGVGGILAASFAALCSLRDFW